MNYITKKLKIKETEAGERADKFLSGRFPKYSRNYFLNLIKDKKILVNQKSIKPSYILKTKDEVEINFVKTKEVGEAKPENIKLNIIYEDSNVIVLNKTAGIVVHPAAGHIGGTLVNALINYFPALSEVVYDKTKLISRLRPGLVHRLDKDTSGTMIIAKNTKTMCSLSMQIQNRTVNKIYWALCYGWPKEITGHLVSYLSRDPKNRQKISNVGKEKGREAISDYKVLHYLKDKDDNKISLIEFNIKTGRTHQIRVQISDSGYPVLGDLFYGSKNSMKLSSQLGVGRQLLHAKSLCITLPGNNKPTEFKAPLPEDFKSVMSKLHQISD